jgi:hypothetical protein
MYIDGFLWLPDIVEKLMIKHQVTQEEVEDVFLVDLTFDLLRKDIDQDKMFILPWGKAMLDVIWQCSSFASRII